MLDLAREYLEHDSQIIFLATQYGIGDKVNYRSKEKMGQYLFDILDIPPGKMPMIGGKEFDDEPFNIYIFMKGLKKEKPRGQSFR